MKIVMTLLVRDEADIVDDHLRFHLDRGVDFVVATDHHSVDGTSEILRRYEREGHAHVIREQREEYVQPIYVTRMARLAASQFGADWVINADADEFWWPRDGTFQEILAGIPERFGKLIGLGRPFVLRPDSDRPFYDRMRWRRRSSQESSSPYFSAAKVIHRADPQVRVTPGNHNAVGRALVLLRDWIPIEILHFPIRSRSHLERKFGRTDLTRARLSQHQLRFGSELRARGAHPIYRRFLVDDEELASGLASGSLIEDARVHDVLTGKSVAREPTLVDDIALAMEVSDWRTMGPHERARRRIDGLNQRVRAVEGSVRSASVE